jgi:hypothetical protein
MRSGVARTKDAIDLLLRELQAGDRIGASSSASYPRGTSGFDEQMFGAE